MDKVIKVIKVVKMAGKVDGYWAAAIHKNCQNF